MNTEFIALKNNNYHYRNSVGLINNTESKVKYPLNKGRILSDLISFKSSPLLFDQDNKLKALLENAIRTKKIICKDDQISSFIQSIKESNIQILESFLESDLPITLKELSSINDVCEPSQDKIIGYFLQNPYRISLPAFIDILKNAKTPKNQDLALQLLSQKNKTTDSYRLDGWVIPIVIQKYKPNNEQVIDKLLNDLYANEFTYTSDDIYAILNRFSDSTSPKILEIFDSTKQKGYSPVETKQILRTYFLTRKSKDQKLRIDSLLNEKLSDGTLRMKGPFIEDTIDALLKNDPLTTMLYNHLGNDGKPLFNARDINLIQTYVEEYCLEKIPDPNQIVDANLNRSKLLKTASLLKLRKPGGSTLNADELLFLIYFELNHKIPPKKLVKLTRFDSMNLKSKKQLVYCLDRLNVAKKDTINKVSNGFSLNDIFINFSNLHFPFITLNKQGNIDTKAFADKIVKTTSEITKFNHLDDPNPLQKLYSALDEFEKLVISGDIDISKVEKIDLDYPRDKFKSDIAEILNGLKPFEAKKLCATFGFEFENNLLYKYPIVLQENEIDKLFNKKLNTKAHQLNSIIKRFTKNNKPHIPQYPRLEKVLEDILAVFPEWYTTIGREQHGSHNYKLDIHTLMVLQESIKRPEWLSKLNDTDRRLAKIAMLLHDLTKDESSIDKLHHRSSARDVMIISKKLNMPETERERVVELIKNHHWLEYVNKTNLTNDETQEIAYQIAFEFRKPNDFEISKIFTYADLKSTSNKIFELYSNVLSSPIIGMIDKKLEKIHANTIPLPQTFIPKAEKINSDYIDIVSEEGTTRNKIININDQTNFEQLGFEKGTTPENFRSFVHVFHNNSESFIKLMENIFENHEKCTLSTTFISKDRFSTLFEEGHKPGYGLLFKTDPSNIIAAYPDDMNSSNLKNKSDCMNYLFVSSDAEEDERAFMHFLHKWPPEKNFKRKYPDFPKCKTINDIKNTQLNYSISHYFEERIKHRTYLSSLIKQELNLSDQDYIKLIGEIQNLGDTNKLKDEKVKSAIIKASNTLLCHQITNTPEDGKVIPWNEVVLFTPYLQGVFVKYSNPEEIPFSLRKMAEKQDLPILIFNSTPT